MTGYEKLCQLKQDRQEFIKVAHKNKMYDGLMKLLTDLYPDTAHFIYELLQNAEDMCASKVKFTLREDKLVFQHNGRKRDFVYEDIDAITSIGNNALKRDDATSIGKFGVGFKAVYTYTKTPEIHSGEFDFRIVDMFVPDPEGVDKTARQGHTKFVFPFNHETKNPKVAFEEIKKGLLELDENSLLFLKNIKTIRFELPNEQIGDILIRDLESDTKNLKSITQINPFDKKSNVTYWCKFTRDCKIKSEGEDKSCSVDIAYRMKKISTDKYTVDSSLNGNVCIYFPAVKEESRLHFHINAPFASTVARDSVRFCSENIDLLDEIAKLCVESIYYFKSRKMIDLNFYATMPNYRDFEDNQGYYARIYRAIIEEFKKSDLILTDTNEYRRASEVMRTNREIAELITSEDLMHLYEKNWVPALQPQSRELYFLLDLDIKQYEKKQIIDIIQAKPSFFDKMYEYKPKEWFKEWYALLYEYASLSNYSKFLKQSKMIRCNDCDLHLPTDEIYIKTVYNPKNIKNPIYVDIDLSTQNAITNKAKNFLVHLGVKELTEQVDIMADIDNKSTVDTDDVQMAILAVIDKYRKKEDISSFKDSPVFLAKKLNDDGVGYIAIARNCCWDNHVAFFYTDDEDNNSDVKYVIDLAEYDSLSSEELLLLREIFEILGGKTKPEIYQTRFLRLNPQCYLLSTNGERFDTCTKRDYSITGLSRLNSIKEQELFAESLLLWNVIVSDKNFQHHMAEYKPNAKAKPQKIESRLAYYLKRIPWIPNKNGEFCRPCDITAEELYEGFAFSEDAIFLKNIGFGDESKAPNEAAQILKRAGFHLSTVDEQLLAMSDEDKQAFLEFMEIKRERERKRYTLSEAILKEYHEQIEPEEFDDYGRDIGLRNVEGRQKKHEQDFEESLGASVKKQKVWKYTYVSKTTGVEKQYVREQYHGKCQMCGREGILKFNGQYYFEAINIINTSLLDEKFLSKIDKGWNTLSLCPNCAAEYKYCSKDLSSLEEQIEKTEIVPKKNEMIDVYVYIRETKMKISFTPKHFQALKAAFKVFKNHVEE